MDYSAFGAPMPGRAGNSGDYRYGFNGKENDAETGTQDYGFRIYNPSLGKFLSVDPLAPEYPWYTPYQFAGNRPIDCIDLDGLEPNQVAGSDGIKNEYSSISLSEGHTKDGTTVTNVNYIVRKDAYLKGEENLLQADGNEPLTRDQMILTFQIDGNGKFAGGSLSLRRLNYGPEGAGRIREETVMGKLSYDITSYDFNTGVVTFANGRSQYVGQNLDNVLANVADFNKSNSSDAHYEIAREAASRYRDFQSMVQSVSDLIPIPFIPGFLRSIAGVLVAEKLDRDADEREKKYREAGVNLYTTYDIYSIGYMQDQAGFYTQKITHVIAHERNGPELHLGPTATALFRTKKKVKP